MNYFNGPLIHFRKDFLPLNFKTAVIKLNKVKENAENFLKLTYKTKKAAH